MFFGNLNKMQNTQLNEFNDEERKIDEYEEFLEQKQKNENISTKIKDCPIKISEVREPFKLGETGHHNSKSDSVKIIKTKEINPITDIHLTSEKAKFELPNLNTNKSPFADSERKNEDNLIFLHKKVKNNKLNEKIVN